MNIEEQFQATAAPRGRLLELGTAQWQPGVSTTVGLDWFPDLAVYTRTDITPGVDVDVVADAHDLAPFGNESFDTVIARSVFEHLARPWIASRAVARVLAPGGIAYIDTHQTFPVHGYPDDYFRFSTEALTVILTDAGLQVLATGYAYECDIVPHLGYLPNWNPAAPAWLHARIIGVKP